jgi:hypothetical protein
MSIYNEKINKGNLYIRKLDGNVDTSVNFLSSIYTKYQNINTFFYDDLIDNRIKNMDVFYDVLFLETDSGYIFDKFIADIDNKIYPYLNDNHFTAFNNTSPCYWFDDKNLKIYIIDIVSGFQNTTSFNFYVLIKEFNCKTGKMYLITKSQIIFNFTNSIDWGNTIPTIEKPVLTYNEYTNNFNLSFVFRNKKGNFALISINIAKKIDLEIDNINLFCDFLDVSDSYHISY